MIEPIPNLPNWRDLTVPPKGTGFREILMPIPWFVVSLTLYASPVWYLGLLASFMFFLCALRLNHEAIHGNLGFARRGDHIVLTVLSALMMGSNHSVAFSHLQHHRDAMGPSDYEGHCGDMRFGQVLLYGPRFPIDLLRAAWRDGGRKWRKRVLGDIVALTGMIALAVIIHSAALWLHVAVMTLAQCMTAFFSVWITHHGCKSAGIEARSQRGIWARLAYLMFYHREHHLFPAVPVSRLPELARRLDDEVPGYANSRMAVI